MKSKSRSKIRSKNRQISCKKRYSRKCKKTKRNMRKIQKGG